MTETIIIKDSEIQVIKNDIVSVAMLNFGMHKYRIQEGYAEWTLLKLAHYIADELSKTDFIEQAIIEGDFLVECVQDKVDKYIKENK